MFVQKEHSEGAHHWKFMYVEASAKYLPPQHWSRQYPLEVREEARRRKERRKKRKKSKRTSEEAKNRRSEEAKKRRREEEGEGANPIQLPAGLCCELAIFKYVSLFYRSSKERASLECCGTY